MMNSHSRKMFFASLMACLFAMLAFVSCSDDDGDWTPMKWKTDAKMDKSHRIDVPSDGGTYSFECTNYGGTWIEELDETVNRQCTVYYRDDDNDAYHFAGKYSEAKFEDNKFTVVIAPNNDSSERKIEVKVSAGDIFDSFTFNQQAVSAQ